MSSKPIVTQQDVAEAFLEVGLALGDAVVVHASLSSFGYVEGGADAVVEAVLSVVGLEGTVVFPTFTGSWSMGSTKPMDERVWTGAVPKAAREVLQVIQARSA